MDNCWKIISEKCFIENKNSIMKAFSEDIDDNKKIFFECIDKVIDMYQKRDLTLNENVISLNIMFAMARCTETASQKVISAFKDIPNSEFYELPNKK